MECNDSIEPRGTERDRDDFDSRCPSDNGCPSVADGGDKRGGDLDILFFVRAIES